jgi:hypothetical protein
MTSLPAWYVLTSTQPPSSRRMSGKFDVDTAEHLLDGLLRRLPSVPAVIIDRGNLRRFAAAGGGAAGSTGSRPART